MKFKFTQVQKAALEMVKGQINSQEVLKKDPQVNEMRDRRKEISAVYKKRPALVKEYMKMYADQEKDPNSYTSYMIKEMRQAVVMKETLKRAAEICEDPREKQDLLVKVKELEVSPEIENYNRYLDGLAYMAGMTDELSPETNKFFTEKLRAPITTDPTYAKYRKLDERELKETQSEELQIYQKRVAPVYARRIYAKSIESTDTLEYQFIPDYPSENRRKVKLVRDRITPVSFLIGRMLAEGYSLDDVMDPNKFREEKKRLGDEYIQHRESGDNAWYINKMYEGSEAMMKAFEDYTKQHKDELKTERDLALHANRLGVLGTCCFDLFQELRLYYRNPQWVDQSKETVVHSLEEYDNVLVKMCSYVAPNSFYHADATEYEAEAICSPESRAIILANEMQSKVFLEEIQKENPDFTRIRTTPEDTNDLMNQFYVVISSDPLYARRRGFEEMNTKELNKAIDLIDGSFIEKNNFSYHKTRIPVSVDKNSPLRGMFSSADKNSFNTALFMNDYQVARSNVPARMELYLGKMEKSGSLRGVSLTNSDQFTALLENFDEVRKNLADNKISNQAYMEEMNKLKEAATNYVLAKREQKGYANTSIDDKSYDAKMLGKEKGADAIFTSRGKERYSFAVNIVQTITEMENAMKAFDPTLAKENTQKEEDMVME